MLQLPFIRENRDLVIAGLKRKYFQNPEEVIENVFELDSKIRSIKQRSEADQAKKKSIEKRMGELMQTGTANHFLAREQAEKELGPQRVHGDKMDLIDLRRFTEELDSLLLTIPNLPHESVPEGRTPEENIQIFSWGSYPALPVDALPHWELIKIKGIIDFELGNKITGAGFPVYRGKGARIQRALINFFLDEAIAAGYLEIQPPILINEASAFATGQLPDKEGQMYEATADKLFLIPTAEVPLTNIYRDVILTENALPVKNVGYTPCFRREAGSWGAHVRGLNRLHQFDKVEIVQIRKPEESYAALEEMLEYVKGLLQKLELPFRILRLCGGDMSFTAALTYDFEVWSGAQQRWLECSSVSNFETYQANRLKLRYKWEGKMQLLHTLNGSALALPRILAALLENNQSPEGIRIPKILVPYCGFETI